MMKLKAVDLTVFGILLIPAVCLMSLAVKSAGDFDLWSHLSQFVLKPAITSSIGLTLLVIAGSSILGITSAWLTTAYQFNGSRLISKLLYLPQAVPAYVAAFGLLSALDWSGSISVMLRQHGISVPDIRNVWGAAATLSLASYPYVYLLARTAFKQTGSWLIDAGTDLGANYFRCLIYLVIPTTWPWLVGGALIAGMEAMSDFGVTSLFGVTTLSTSVYRTWYLMYSLEGAAALSLILLVLALTLNRIQTKLVDRSKNGLVNSELSGKFRPKQLKGLGLVLAYLWFGTILGLSVVIPVTEIAKLADWQSITTVISDGLLQGSFIAALGTTLLSLVLFAGPTATSKSADWVGAGYAVPGAVFAIALFIPVAEIDQALGWNLRSTLTVMWCALTLKFACLAVTPIRSALLAIPKNQIEAAQSLGANSTEIWIKVKLPQITPAIWTASLMVGVETLKEMPITLMTRTSDFQTLATRIYDATSDGMWGAAAGPAIVLLAITTLILLLSPPST